MVIYNIIIIYTARPNVKSELIPITKECDDLGEALGLPIHVVQTIRTNHPGDVRRRMNEVVDRWFEKKGNPPSWNNLCEALKKPLIDRKDIVSSIETKYSY